MQGPVHTAAGFSCKTNGELLFRLFFDSCMGCVMGTENLMPNTLLQVGRRSKLKKLLKLLDSSRTTGVDL